MKKVLALTMLFLLLFCNACFADVDEEEEHDVLEILQEVTSNNIDDITINSRAAVVIDKNSKTILYSKNHDSRRAMASTTKVISYQR